MSDLLDDQRGKDLLAADPGVVNALGVMFRDVATQAQTTADGLRGAAGDADWTGSASSAFRQGLGKLPGDLDKVTQSYQESADALNSFEGELNSLKPAFQNIVSQLQSAQGALSGAQSQLSSAQSSLSTAQAKASTQSIASPLASLTTVPLSSPLHTAVNAASGAVSNAQGEIDSLTSRGFSLLDEFDSRRGAAQSRVSSASHVPPHRGFWDSVFHDVGNFMLDAGKFVVGLGKDIVDSVTGTVGAFETWLQHPTNLADLGKLAGDLAVDASIVVLVAAAPEALGLVGAAEAAADAGTEEGVSLAARLATVGDDAGQVAKGATGLNAATDFGQGHFTDGAIDVAFMNLPDGDDVANGLKVGEDQSEEAAATSNAVQTFK
jgi:hypothetical protein